ncbi:MAG: hypothetical protein SGI77_01335 [Pirellulaceae bacterium]|nr:hypothetical protein [Pirellulaceae bacterium]
MTIDELIEHLEEYRDLIGGDAEVRLMTQQSWPFEYDLHGVCSGEEINEMTDEDAAKDKDDTDDEDDVTDDKIFYLVEGTQLGYGSKRAWSITH